MPPASPLRIVVIGDSTVCDYPADPQQRGWGQMLPEFFNAAGVKIINLAIGGRSSKSFLDENRWQQVLDMAPAPDYVLIQFGHNDNPGKPADMFTFANPVPAPLPPEGIGSRERDWYRNNLCVYVEQSRSIGAIPVIVTPMERHLFDAEGGVQLRNQPYAQAALDVAQKTHTLAVDLHEFSVNTYNGSDPSVTAALHVVQADGQLDHSHYNAAGARRWAAFIAEHLQADARLRPLIRPAVAAAVR